MTVISQTQLENASVDAESFQQFINGADNLDVITRLGRVYPTLAKLAKIVETTPINFIAGATYANEAAAQAAITAGTIANGVALSVKSTADDYIFNMFYNNNGTLAPLNDSAGNQKVAVAKEYIDSAIAELRAFADPVKYIENTTTNTTFFHRWKDKIGTIIAGWKNDDFGGVYFISKLLKFGPDGFFGQGMSLSKDIISSEQITFKKGSNGEVRIIDKRGVVLAKVKNGKVFLETLNIVSGNNGLVFSRDQNGFTIKDKRGVIGLRVNKYGFIEGALSSASASTQSAISESQILQMLEGYAAAKQANRYNTVYSCPKNLSKKIKVILIYGQSFSVGAQSNSALTISAKYGNVMLGDSPRGSFFSNPPAGSEIYGPVGGNNVFKPLREVCQDTAGAIVTSSGYGETICSTVGNEFKRLHNEALGVDNDDNFIVCVGSCGVSGRSIAQLQKGASPELYNRVETFLDGVVEACSIEGVEFEVVGIIYMQGENDNSQSYSYYLAQSKTMRQNLINSCKAKSGQNFDPIYIVNQIGNGYVTGTGVPNAQIQLPEEVAKTVNIGSYQGLPNPGAHLCANSYRKIGAIFAKELYRYYSGNSDYAFKAVKAVHKKDTAYVAFSPKVAPLTFKSVYVQWTETLHADYGITVTDSVGTLTASDFTVSIASDRVLKIKANRDFNGNVTIRLGDSAHSGTHNIADSSPETSALLWEYSGTTPGQYTQENIPALVNQPYSLVNFAAVQSITSEVM